LLQDFIRRYSDDTLEKPLTVGSARIGIWERKDWEVYKNFSKLLQQIMF
jgi:hypothetical protein